MKMKSFIITCSVALIILIPCDIYLFQQDIAALRCPICQLAPTDGVALVDTQTGAIENLAPRRNGSSGYIQVGFFGCGMSHGTVTPGHYQFDFIPKAAQRTAYPCPYHAALIDTSYVLADAQQKPTAVYPVEAGRAYQIGCCDISIGADGDRLVITVASRFNGEEQPCQ